MSRLRISTIASAAMVTIASAASLLLACSSAGVSSGESDGGDVDDVEPHDGGVTASGEADGESAAQGDAQGGEGSDDGGARGDSGSSGGDEEDSCIPADGTYTVTYTETESAEAGCQETDGGSVITVQTFPAPAAGDVDDGGSDAGGCSCTGSTLACTFSSLLRGTSTSTTTLSETFTANGWTGTVSHEVNFLDGGVKYLCTQAVRATKD